MRAKGVEPSRSFEHRHLKPACLPFHHARRQAIVPLDELVRPKSLLPRGTVSGVSTTRRRRPALIALVIVAASGCLALGWWQWTRFHSPSGTFQNLGYAMQWPLFAWFCVYSYRNFVRYEEEPPQPRNAVTEIPAELLPERPKPVSNRPPIPRCASTTPIWPSSRSATPKRRTGPPHDRTRDARSAAGRASFSRRGSAPRCFAIE